MSPKIDQPLNLVADVGGTNTRVGLALGQNVLGDSVIRYRNAEFDSLEAVLRADREARGGTPISQAAVAVAGPVENGVGKLTNLSWTIDTDLLCSSTGAQSGAVLNDLQAQGYALDHLHRDVMMNLVPGKTRPNVDSRLVIGVGTGFNAAPVLSWGSRVTVLPSECGHITLPAINGELRALSDALAEANHGFAEVEDVLSGRGLEHCDTWVTTGQVRTRLRDAATMMKAVEENEDAANKALYLFCETFGIVAGDLALTHLPFGGIYLVGGVARSTAPYLHSHGFFKAFSSKGRFSEYMSRFPISVITDDAAALTGCASYLASIRKNFN